MIMMPILRLSAAAAITLVLMPMLPNSPRLAAQRADTVATDTSRSARALAVVKIRGRADNMIGIASSASQGRIGRPDLRGRPLQREGELLESVPGMILTQHSGDGKANQMVVRGFNLDHGTDFQTRLESMPLNLPTHGHGHGYTDINPLIPEFVDHLEYKLGPMYAEIGDFGSAGGASLQLIRTLTTPVALLEGGAFGYRRTVLGAGGSRMLRESSADTTRTTSGAQASDHWLVGGEAKQYDGPWATRQRLGKLSGLARYTWRRERSELSLLALGYRNAWNASDQIPERAIRTGALTRFDQIDPSLGGEASRASISGTYARRLRQGTLSLEAYLVQHDLTLHSNFTYFLEAAERGDQITQTDVRTLGGVNGEVTRVLLTGGVSHLVRKGVQLRADDIQNGLFQSAARTIADTVRRDRVRQGSAGMYVSIESRWRPAIRTLFGYRQDVFQFDVQSDNPRNSGERIATIGSPKLSAVITPRSHLELYIGGGLGFHSNDARGITTTVNPITGEAVHPVTPLVRSRAAEMGVRIARSDRARSTAALWTLDLDSELLFVGDAGTTEPQGRSRRIGVTMANYWRPVSSLAVDADLSFTRARYVSVSTDNRVPGAFERVMTAGVQWELPHQVVTTARVRHFGAAALIEDNSRRGTPTTLLNMSLGWRVRGVQLTATVLNAANARANDVQYFYASRLPGESGEGVPDVHVHPVEPRMLRVGISRGF